MFKDRMIALLKNPRTINAMVFFAGVTVGGGVAGVLTRKFYAEKFEDELEEELAKTRKYYSVLYKEGEEFQTPRSTAEFFDREEAVQHLSEQEILRRRYQEAIAPYMPPRKTELTVSPNDEPETVQLYIKDPAELDEEDGVVVQNIFDVAEDELDTQEDLTEIEKYIIDREAHLSAQDQPYPITESAFFSDERGFKQLQLTWWPQNQVLVDHHENEVFDVDGLVLLQNLAEFSLLSQDGTTLYIRNPARSEEYEIMLDEGNYSHEVLGFVAHSDRPGSYKVPRFVSD